MLKIRFHFILSLELSRGTKMSGFTKFGLVPPPGKLVVNFFLPVESWNSVFPLERVTWHLCHQDPTACGNLEVTCEDKSLLSLLMQLKGPLHDLQAPPEAGTLAQTIA